MTIVARRSGVSRRAIFMCAGAAIIGLISAFTFGRAVGLSISTDVRRCRSIRVSSGTGVLLQPGEQRLLIEAFEQPLVRRTAADLEEPRVGGNTARTARWRESADTLESAGLKNFQFGRTRATRLPPGFR